MAKRKPPTYIRCGLCGYRGIDKYSLRAVAPSFIPGSSLTEASWLASFRLTSATEAGNPAAADAWQEAIDAIEHARLLVKRAEQIEAER